MVGVVAISGLIDSLASSLLYAFVRGQTEFVQQLVIRSLCDEVVAQRVESVRDAVVEPGASLLVLRVYVRAVPQQRLDDPRVSVLARDDERAVAELIAPLRRAPALEQVGHLLVLTVPRIREQVAEILRGELPLLDLRVERLRLCDRTHLRTQRRGRARGCWLPQDAAHLPRLSALQTDPCAERDLPTAR